MYIGGNGGFASTDGGRVGEEGVREGNRIYSENREATKGMAREKILPINASQQD